MIDIRRILCPIDFSETSRHAVAHAIALARWYQARITALFVSHPEILLQPPLLFAEFSGDEPAFETVRRSAPEELLAWLEPARSAGLESDVIVDDGDPVRHILHRAATLPADLIVMGTHGRSGFEHLLLGSVTEKVLRKAPCPVLSVPPPAATASKLPYTHLLCAVDFSDSSLAALRVAFSIAEEADARLTILHVFDWRPEGELLTQRFDTAAYLEAIEQQARDRLAALVPAEARVWCKPETVVRHGKPYREILNVAAEKHADLILVGIHGRNPIDLALFGSTTNQLVRCAPCPVLTMGNDRRRT